MYHLLLHVSLVSLSAITPQIDTEIASPKNKSSPETTCFSTLLHHVNCQYGGCADLERIGIYKKVHVHHMGTFYNIIFMFKKNMK